MGEDPIGFLYNHIKFNRIMAKIKIISDKKDTAKPKHVPKSSELNKVVNRFQPPGGKPTLHLSSSYNRQGTK